MPDSQTFDAVVLGAGPGGYVAAIRLAQLGKSVALIEEKYWGGVCLNVGCIPTKALLKNAEVASLVTTEAAHYGIGGEITVDYSAAFNRSRQVSEGRVKGIHYLTKKNGITEFEGRGTFLSANSISVATASGEVVINFTNAIIAAGASPRQIPGIAFTERVVNYEQQILSQELPKSIVIVGAGPIGVEFAFVMSSYGTEVTIVEAQDRALPLEDADTSKEIAKLLRSKKINLLTGASLTGIDETTDAVTVNLNLANGEAKQLVAEKAMIAIGFGANVTGYGLENTGVELAPNKTIQVNSHLQTNVSSIYAIGDVTGKMQLAHVAEHQGVVAAETIAGAEPAGIDDYRAMPRAIFTTPQVASFGPTEEQARAENAELLVSKFSMVANGKAHALGVPAGFVKLIADAGTRKLIGAHIVAADASELIAELTLASSAGVSIDDMNHNVHIHPTLSEGIQEAIHGLVGEMINA